MQATDRLKAPNYLIIEITTECNFKCKQCHQFKADADSNAVFVPIGPKARHLNRDYAYADGTMNQLSKIGNSQKIKDNHITSLIMCYELEKELSDVQKGII